jgi:hypothetical protein
LSEETYDKLLGCLAVLFGIVVYLICQQLKPDHPRGWLQQKELRSIPAWEPLLNSSPYPILRLKRVLSMDISQQYSTWLLPTIAVTQPVTVTRNVLKRVCIIRDVEGSLRFKQLE